MHVTTVDTQLRGINVLLSALGACLLPWINIDWSIRPETRAVLLLICTNSKRDEDRRLQTLFPCVEGGAQSAQGALDCKSY